MLATASAPRLRFRMRETQELQADEVATVLRGCRL